MSALRGPLPTGRLPSDPAQALQEAVDLHRRGQLGPAEKIYTRLLKIFPRHFDALHLLGMVRQQQGKSGEALRLISRALEIEPGSPDALSNLAIVLRTLGRPHDALAALDRALAAAPGHAAALANRGAALLDLARPEEALAVLDPLVAANPRHLESRFNRANALAALDRAGEALPEYDAILAAVPTHVGAHYNRGNALQALGRFEEAIATYDGALALAPDHVKALINRGMALQALVRLPEAIESFRRSIAIDKTNADAHHNEALALLLSGDFRRGFAKYEWRWKRSGMPSRRSDRGRPLWLGEYPLHGKRILLHAEQGLGDTIQFARYAPMVAASAAEVVLEVQPELKAMLAQLPGVTVIARGDALSACDLHCPLGSLPLALKTEPDSIPSPIPYLRAGQDRLAKWADRLGRTEGKTVALAWSGRPSHANDRNRSIPLAAFDRLLAVPGVRFIAVQPEVRPSDAEWLRQDARLENLGPELADFTDTAAVLALADLLVAVDTSVVHLAGAMGRPVWVLLPYSPDWRWQLDRPDSPWYPTARLFRQSAPGQWAPVLAQVAETLTEARPE